MQTSFTPRQLADPAMAASEAVIRKCVHCGFCTATCPTYVLLGDELDSPRGRIYLMKEMLQQEARPTAEVVKHVDRCLSCLACVTTCPSDVNYRHLVDHARAYIEARYRRPLIERMTRALLAAVLPHPRRFRAVLALARLARPAQPLLEGIPALKPLGAMLALTPPRARPEPSARPSPVSRPRGRVALLQGCAEPVLRPEIREAAVRLINRAGFDVVFAPGEGCCGALAHHMGRDRESLAAARRNIDAWDLLIEQGLGAILVAASGCGSTIKDYGFMLRADPAYADKAARIASLARDAVDWLADVGMPEGSGGEGIRVAYHAACSLQHGLNITATPQALLTAAGFEVRTPAEAHLCCGSAGVYNILQSGIAGRLGDRKAANLGRLKADVVATGNIGCAVQIGARTGAPVVHTLELLDWATGGPLPPAMEGREWPS